MIFQPSSGGCPRLRPAWIMPREGSMCALERPLLNTKVLSNIELARPLGLTAEQSCRNEPGLGFPACKDLSSPLNREEGICVQLGERHLSLGPSL